MILLLSTQSGKQEMGPPKSSALFLCLLWDAAVGHLLLLGYRLLPRRQCGDTGAVGIAGENPVEGRKDSRHQVSCFDSLNLCLLLLMLMLLFGTGYGTKVLDVLKKLLFYFVF